MKALMALLFLQASLAGAVSVDNFAGWSFIELPKDAAIQKFSGHAKWELVSGKNESTVNVYIHELNQVPEIDLRSRDSWREKIIGANPKTLTIVSDSIFKIGAATNYICHYQTNEGSDLPYDTILRASIDNGKLFLFMYKQDHATYQLHSAEVYKLLRNVTVSN